MNPTDYTPTNTTGCYPTQPQPCPTCGHCPTCGRGGYQTYPYWHWPNPWITWTISSTGNLTTDNPNGTTGTQTWKEQPTTLT